ncbi:DUF3037 domain-containing protein [Maribacter confluentis]|uniref:DUF3037 domain-containing protein n=2 Tax=Maribacter TaxID=252356 RepID=A0ABY1SKG2_9FLAO|nr:MULTISPECIES: DUF3037 domain-containing protein [Maribacter]MDO1514441.1 DUF3037 domain-containing protein [Maribacter confluentis]SNR64959.1 Protein of unknown function [Maribacter sedimenticola]
MQDRYLFKYAIIRIVPKVEREEFFNVGVILYCKRLKFLDIKYYIDTNKLKVFSPELEPSLINTYLEGWKLICDGNASGGAIGKLDLTDRFGWLTACRSTIIQSSTTRSGLSVDPIKELEYIFKEYVL